MFAAMKRALLLSLLALALPATALADNTTTTVDPAAGGSCTRAGTCRTIGDAVGVSQDSDVIKVRAGTYAENVTIPSDLTGVTLSGDPGALVTGTGSGTPLTIHGANTTVAGLGAVTAASADPTVVADGGNLTVADSIVYSLSGTALSIPSSFDNKVQRTTIVTIAGADAADGIKLGAAGLVVDSSIVVGGVKGAAYRVTTAAGSADALLTLNHVSTTGAGNGIVLDGAGSLVPAMPVGDITLKVDSSIVHGASTAGSSAGQTSIPPLPNVQDPNTVTATYTSSDATQMEKSGGTGEPSIAGGGNPTADSAVFGKNLRLKAGSPVIDKGGAIVAGESDRDIDGEPRSNGAGTDIGADEFTNHAPVLTLAVTPGEPKTSEIVTATGTATDKEGGDDILGYSVDWGDGTKRDSTASNVIQHVYEKPGTYTVTMVTADKSFAFSEAKTQTVTLTDGTPPQLQVTTPKQGARVSLNPKRRKPRRLEIKGVDADASGIKQIEVALTKVGSKCRQYAGRRFARAACDKYVFLKATLSGNGFRLTTRRGLRVRKGTYEIRARATDLSGNATSTFDKATKTLVRFKVK